jgi:perosamine synthetase
MNRIYYTKPSITDLEIKYANDAAANGWGEKCYDYIYKFESLFRNYIGTKYSVATSSCTGALHLGLAALGIKKGDEVIIADINWIASAAPVIYVGAKPVFVDVLPDTWCIDPKKVEKAINRNTRAIIAVHLYGNLCEMDELRVIAKKHGLILIEDAAEAIGSEYKGKKTGSMGDFGVFSFHGTKTVTTGEGGMLVTNNKQLYRKVQLLNNHGRNPKCKKQFWPDILGYKYKISNIQAAIGCAQMERLSELLARKREIFLLYKLQFRDFPFVAMNPEKKGTRNSFWMPTIVLNDKIRFNRKALLLKFKAQNIDGRVFFYPLSSLSFFKKCKRNTVSYDISPRALNLPSYHDITDGQIKTVAKVIQNHFRGI